MVFPSADPLWILELIKVIIMFALWALLLLRWKRADRHFYTDIPFLFAWGFFILACAESVDVVFHSMDIFTYEFLIYKIRATFTGFSLVFFLFPTTRLWFEERRLLGNALTVLYMILLTALIIVAPTADMLLLLVMPFMLVVYVGYAVSFFLAWLWKRLPDVHGLVMSLGGTVTIMGQIAKFVILTPLGLMWVAEIIEVSGLLILWLGLVIKPGYAS